MTEKNIGAASGDLGVMEGKGFYNRHSRPQRGAVAFGLPLLEHAIGAVPLPDPGEVLQVADYGVAGGNNSMEPMRTIIDGVRRRSSEDLAVSVFHTDLPTNDFDTLFTLLASPDSYLQGTSNVFAYAWGKSFYERLFPASHLHIGWNAIAIHWLSRVPATIPDHIWSNRATGTVRRNERMVIPTYNRTLKEFEAPFSASQKESPLELESSSEVVLPDPFWSEYEQSG